MGIRMTKRFGNFLAALAMLSLVGMCMAWVIADKLRATHSPDASYAMAVGLVCGPIAIAIAWFLYWKRGAHERYAQVTDEQFPLDDLDFLRQSKAAAGMLRAEAMKAKEFEEQLEAIKKELAVATYLTAAENQSYRSQIESIRSSLGIQTEVFEDKMAVFYNVGIPVEKDMLAYQTMTPRGK